MTNDVHMEDSLNTIGGLRKEAEAGVERVRSRLPQRVTGAVAAACAWKWRRVALGKATQPTDREVRVRAGSVRTDCGNVATQLERALLKLDSVESFGDAEVRRERKALVRAINAWLTESEALVARAAAAEALVERLVAQKAAVELEDVELEESEAEADDMSTSSSDEDEQPRPSWSPESRWVEDRGTVLLQVAAAGVPRESLSLRLEDDVLVIEGDKPQPTREDVFNYRMYGEQRWGRFELRTRVPTQLADLRYEPEVRLERGLLTVRFAGVRRSYRGFW